MRQINENKVIHAISLAYLCSVNYEKMIYEHEKVLLGNRSSSALYFLGNRMYPASPGSSGIRIRFCPE